MIGKKEGIKMSDLYFVLFEKSMASNSREAREVAVFQLNENGFVIPDDFDIGDEPFGFWQYGACSSFRVGSNFSGVLLYDKDKLPVRDLYKEFGYDDDAMILTKEVFNHIKKNFPEKDCFLPIESLIRWIGDLDDNNELEIKFIDEYWIVAINCWY